MGINFIGEAGVYLPARDAIKITAVDGERVVDCYVRRSALDAIECPGLDAGPELIRHFQKHRDTVQVAAMVKYRRALTPPTELDIEAADLVAVLPAAAA
jgi:hypothetical protein